MLGESSPTYCRDVQVGRGMNATRGQLEGSSATKTVAESGRPALVLPSAMTTAKGEESQTYKEGMREQQVVKTADEDCQGY